jgi:DNA-directed RNA polymerase subunit M/transcription elongation factor TFIIS
MIKGIPFITGKSANYEGLLSRFLPPIPKGIGSKWVTENLAAGSWVFDPFGSSPEFALEMARAGFRVLISANNPISRFIVEFGANPPSKDDLRSALAELASTRVGEERLEIHIQQLYETKCSQCGQSVIAQAFLWERDATAPYAKIYECKNCGDSGERAVIQSDIDLAKSFTAASLHRTRVLERITPPGDLERNNVEEALSVYLPRAIYVLITLANRLNSLLASPNILKPTESIHQLCLIALVINALDRGNNLWSYPSGRLRPKQLSASPRFREANLWHTLEESIDQLAIEREPVPLSIFPHYPPAGGGVVLYRGPLRNLSEDLTRSTAAKSIQFDAISTVIPRHNQAFWTLSALWAGWIWGHDAIGSFRSVLRRRRYDWSWHCAALNSAFDSLANILRVKMPLFGLIPEAESNFLCAALIAAQRSGFALSGIALRADTKLSQVYWDFEPGTQKDYQLPATTLLEDQQVELIVIQGVKNLRKRGEPEPYITSYTSALLSLSENQGISRDEQISAADEYSRIHQLIEKSLSYKHGFIRYGGGEKSSERANIWHQDVQDPTNLLSDKVEIEIYQLLAERVLHDLQSIDQSICDIFPGLMTPDFELISTCIESYSTKESLESGEIILRNQDDPERRTLELAAIRLSLCDLGHRLGFSAQGQNPIIWLDGEDSIRLVFYVSSSASIGNIIFTSQHPPDKSIIVLPGARANLIMYKLRFNPHLNQSIEDGWRFLKFRHFRHLLESPSLSKDNLDTLLALDPLTESPAQMRLL